MCETMPTIKMEPLKENVEKCRELEMANVSSQLEPSTKIEDPVKEVFANCTPGESSHCRVKKLYELFGSRASEGECENALQLCNGNIHGACELLQKSYAFEDTSNDGDRDAKPKDCHSVFRQSELDSHDSETRNCGLKRRARSTVGFLSPCLA